MGSHLGVLFLLPCQVVELPVAQLLAPRDRRRRGRAGLGRGFEGFGLVGAL